MNRILQVGNKFLVLVTPTFVSNPSIELLLGAWTDENIRGYHVAEFSTSQDAIDLAFKFPTIDWNKIISLHEDAFIVITNSIKDALSNGSYIVEIDSNLSDPTDFKKIIFKRVAHRGQRFNLFYDANDVISINIINPWTANLVQMANLLKIIPELRIRKITRSDTHITLIGITDADTTYEIRLWTSLVAQWVRWIQNNDLDPRMYMSMLSQIIKKQKIIDDGNIIR